MTCAAEYCRYLDVFWITLVMTLYGAGVLGACALEKRAIAERNRKALNKKLRPYTRY